jgi:hypothetical protein
MSCARWDGRNTVESVPPPPPLLLLLLPQEFTSWTKAAGFKSTELIHLIGPNSAAVAYK